MNSTSPCVALCKLDEDDVCIGCNRTIEEITNWRHYSASQRESIVSRLNNLSEQKSDTHS